MIERYSRKEIKRIWEDHNKYTIWLSIELAAAEAKAAKAKAKKDRKFFLDVVKQVEKNSIAAEKLGNKLAKKTIALLKWAQANDFELEDIVNILESQVEEARSDNNMVTIIDIA